jgi:hypothetical protein
MPVVVIRVVAKIVVEDEDVWLPEFQWRSKTMHRGRDTWRRSDQRCNVDGIPGGVAMGDAMWTRSLAAYALVPCQFLEGIARNKRCDARGRVGDYI